MDNILYIHSVSSVEYALGCCLVMGDHHAHILVADDVGRRTGRTRRPRCTWYAHRVKNISKCDLLCDRMRIDPANAGWECRIVVKSVEKCGFVWNLNYASHTTSLDSHSSLEICDQPCSNDAKTMDYTDFLSLPPSVQQRVFTLRRWPVPRLVWLTRQLLRPRC